jgi:uncharacterized repeat protein (TIGR03803 family)
MKKYTVLSFLLLITGVGYAQFTKLLDFNGQTGNEPYGSVILSTNDSVLYGMTNAGGSSGAGNVFTLRIDGSAYDSIHSFVQTITSGANPYGSLTLSGGKLYGMTGSSGAHSNGTIFSIDPSGSGFTNLFDFTDTIGANPNGALVISGNMMYGTTTTSGGGLNGFGSVFSIQTNGTGVKQLVGFTGPNGRKPCPDLVLSGNVLYGMTSYGGSNGFGIIFSVHTDGSSFTDLYDFTNSNSTPVGSLTIAGNHLFGCMGGAGLFNKGFIFSIRTDGAGFRDIFDFDGTNGQNPLCTPLVSGKTLYGTTCNGGVHSYGTIFSVDTSGTNFNNLYSFTTQDGQEARSQLTKSGNTLYGTAVMGGANGDGTVFSFKVAPSSVPICMVTTDDSSRHNIVIWQKPAPAHIDSFIIFREITSNNYRQIGAVPYAALSEFVDTVATRYFPFSGNPNAGTYRYKLQVRDSSGNYSLLSPYHNTLFVTQTGGTFNWNQYTIEGDSIPLPSISAYVLYRDDNSTGVWHQIVGVSGGQTTATDPNYSSYPNGSWRVETMWGITCTPTKSSFSSSKSNIKGKDVSAGIQTWSASNPLEVFPNPAIHTLTLSGIKQETLVRLIDMMGKTVFETKAQNTVSIDISQLAQGIYTLEADCLNSRMFRKVVIAK